MPSSYWHLVALWLGSVNEVLMAAELVHRLLHGHQI